MNGGEICIIFGFYLVKEFLLVCLIFWTVEFIKNNDIKTQLLSHSEHITNQLQYGKAIYGTNHCISRESYRTGSYTLRTNSVNF